MKTTELKAFVRDETGKKNTKALRKDGKVPAVIYDNSAVTHIYIDAKASRKIVYTPDTYIVKLDVDGKVVDTVIREMQFHPVKDYLEHVEFLRVSDEKEVEVVLPIKMVGTPKGVTVGGKLTVKLRRIKVKGIPSQLPENLEVDVRNLEMGGTIKIEDVDFGDIKIMTSSSAAIASVEVPRTLRSSTAKAAAAAEGAAGAAEEVAEEAS